MPRAKERLGFLPENPYFYDYLTAREFLDFYAQLFRYKKRCARERVASLLKLVGLDRAPDLQLRKFSRGMLQRDRPGPGPRSTSPRSSSSMSRWAD